MPVAAVVAPVITGFWLVELNVFGPLQVKVPPVTFAAFRLSALPEHTGVLEDKVGAAGIGATETVVVAAAETQPATVTVALYTPEASGVAFVIDGF